MSISVLFHRRFLLQLVICVVVVFTMGRAFDNRPHFDDSQMNIQKWNVRTPRRLLQITTSAPDTSSSPQNATSAPNFSSSPQNATLQNATSVPNITSPSPQGGVISFPPPSSLPSAVIFVIAAVRSPPPSRRRKRRLASTSRPKMSSFKGCVVFSNAARSFSRCGGREPSTHVSLYASSTMNDDGESSCARGFGRSSR